MRKLLPLLSLLSLSSVARGEDALDVAVLAKPKKAPTISAFTATPASGLGFASSTLAWTYTGTEPVTLSIDQGVGTVTGSASTSVAPEYTTTYTLTATNAKGTATAQATVTTTGPYLIADDANTVLHAWWNGSVLADSKSVAWSMQGTVPQVAANGVIPPGAGPTSTTNYYRTPATNGTTDFAGDFMCCSVFYCGASIASDSYFVSDYNGSFGGWYQRVTSSGKTWATFVGNGTTLPNAATTTTIQLNGVVNVGCGGKTGTTIVSKLNLGTMASTGSAGTTSAATTTFGRIGGTSSAGQVCTMVEQWCTTTTPTDAGMIAVMNQVKSRLGISAW